MKILCHALSDQGKVRDNNEDAFLCLDDCGLFAVADGMGGHACGEVASSICIDALRDAHTRAEFLSALRERHKTFGGGNGLRPPFRQFVLQSAIEYANYSILKAAQRNPDRYDMGTTVVSLHIAGRRAYLGSVGDSRIYLLRGGRLRQLTEDHSLANEYIKLELLDPADIARFPYRNVIVRALGLADSVDVDTQWRCCREDDRFLLCTDGLTDLVSDTEIADVMARAASPSAANEDLVALALERGGIDNITVLNVWAVPDILDAIADREQG